MILLPAKVPAWAGDFKWAYSNNPAWIFYDLVLDKIFGMGNRVDASMIDKWEVYAIAQYCDERVSDGAGGTEPRFTCNVYIQSQQDAYGSERSGRNIPGHYVLG
jgi:predicted phage tail protein